MKIEKLIIYGFGKHENVTIDFKSGINVLYGLNEAGKTTIQQFILHVLFGFPQRNSALLRYEPKSGGKYGGQVQLIDNVYGKCSIERIRGKSSGEVTVHFEDGTRGTEEALKGILRQYDRTSFESIFSFSLFQLQGFEKMDEEELSRTLLASGTTGVDSLLQLEKRMENEMGDLFKKSGRIPKMNVKMKELRELEFELREAQEKIAEYAPSIERIREIEEQLSSLRDQEEDNLAQLKQLSHLRQLMPLQQRKKEMEHKVEQLGIANFPADGIRRFESVASQLTETKVTKQRIEEELTELKLRIPEKHQANRMTAIELLIAKESEWHSWRSKALSFDSELHRLTGRKHRLRDRLGNFEESMLLEADVSIRKEEEMHELLDKIEESTNRITLAENHLENLESEISLVKKKQEEMKAPTAEEIQQAEQWPTLRQQLAEAKAYISFKENQTEQNNRFIPTMILLLAIAFVSFGILQQQWFVVALGVIIGGIGAVFYSKNNSKDDAKLAEMKSFVSAYSGKEEDMDRLLTRIETYKRDSELQLESLRTLEHTFELEDAALSELYRQRSQIESVFDEFVQSYGFDGLPSAGIVPELFRMIRELHEIEREMKEITKGKHELESKLERRTEEVEEVLQQVVTSDLMYELLRKEYIRIQDESETRKSLTTRIEQLTPALKEATLHVKSLEETLRSLLIEADANTEEEFYSAYDRYQEVIRLREQIVDIEAQLSASGLGQLVEKVSEDDCATKIADIEDKLSCITEKSHTLINEKASLANKTERLLTDETYGHKLQLFEMKKAELAELAKKWSARQAVAEAIRRTMTELKETKLPNVLEQAERMFNVLTDGKYEALVVTDEGMFEVVSENGMRYPIVELSQATKEQAYISLRFALAASVLDTAPFPIMMDDPFVHFDEERLSRMINLLSEMNQHQFIYFTCHRKMKNNMMNGTIINVSELGSEQGVGVQ